MSALLIWEILAWDSPKVENRWRLEQKFDKKSDNQKNCCAVAEAWYCLIKPFIFITGLNCFFSAAFGSKNYSFVTNKVWKRLENFNLFIVVKSWSNQNQNMIIKEGSRLNGFHEKWEELCHNCHPILKRPHIKYFWRQVLNLIVIGKCWFIA